MLCPKCGRPCQHINEGMSTVDFTHKPQNGKVVLVSCQNPECEYYGKLLKKVVKIDLP